MPFLTYPCSYSLTLSVVAHAMFALPLCPPLLLLPWLPRRLPLACWHGGHPGQRRSPKEGKGRSPPLSVWHAINARIRHWKAPSLDEKKKYYSSSAIHRVHPTNICYSASPRHQQLNSIWICQPHLHRLVSSHLISLTAAALRLHCISCYSQYSLYHRTRKTKDSSALPPAAQFRLPALQLDTKERNRRTHAHFHLP